MFIFYCRYKQCANSANSWMVMEYLSMWRSQFRPGRLVRRKPAGIYLRTNIATNKINPRSQSPRGPVSQSHSRIRWSNNYWSIAPTSQWDYLRTPKSYGSCGIDTSPSSQKKRNSKKLTNMKRYLRIHQHGNENPRFINQICQTGGFTQRMTSVDGLCNTTVMDYLHRSGWPGYMYQNPREKKRNVTKSNMPNRRYLRRAGFMGI